jgi:polyphosphate kinase 2 (PPK2 family)
VNPSLGPHLETSYSPAGKGGMIKYWLDTSMEVQERRFKDRIEDPRKIWKLSPMTDMSFLRSINLRNGA